MEGAAEGWYLESRVDQVFKLNYFKAKETQFEIRYLFAYVGTKKNSEKTIYMHRKESENLMNLLIGKDNHNLVIIVDID